MTSPVGAINSLTMVVYGASKVGKALKCNTPILTSNGWSTMEEIKVGDQVHTHDGTLTDVTYVSDIFVDRECYEITTKSGRTVVADAEHLWTVQDTRGRTSTVTTEYLRDNLMEGHSRRFRIPIGVTLERPEIELPVHPYVLGLWLGDGRHEASSISKSHDDLAEIGGYIEDIGYFHTEPRVDGAAWSITLGPTPIRGGNTDSLLSRLRTLGALGNKHLPDVYLTGSVKQRAALLAGLMDTDGSAETRVNNSGRAEFTTVLPHLALSVQTLAISLGYKASIVVSPYHGYSSGLAYRVKWVCDRESTPFWLKRKTAKLPLRATLSDAQRRRPSGTDTIVSVTRTHSVPVKCIRVSDPSGLFLAGRQLMLTHNTTLALTAPYPRLVLDVEGGTRFALINRVYWDPMRAEPPVADGSWDTCIVHCTSFEIMLRAYQWLQSGKHQFNSLIIDSISELQVKVIEQIAGRSSVQLQAWGDIGRATSGLMRDCRDLVMHPTKPLQAIVLTAMERTDQKGKLQPYLSGQSAITLPYLMDCTGYLVVEEYPNPDPTAPPLQFRRMYISPSSRYVAGERVGGRLGSVVEQADLSITEMINRIYRDPFPEPKVVMPDDVPMSDSMLFPAPPPPLEAEAASPPPPALDPTPASS